MNDRDPRPLLELLGVYAMAGIGVLGKLFALYVVVRVISCAWRG